MVASLLEPLTTHTGVLQRAAEYMKSLGWERVIGKRIFLNSMRADLVLANEFGLLMVAEIKPLFITRDEVWRGIGETVRFLPLENLGTILICPVEYEVEIAQIFKAINSPRLGLLVFSKSGYFRPVIDIWNEKGNWPSWLGNKRVSLATNKVEPFQLYSEVSVTPCQTILKCANCDHEWIARKRRTLTYSRSCPRCQLHTVYILSDFPRDVTYVT